MRERLVRRWAPPNHTSTYARCQDDYDGQRRSPPDGVFEMAVHRTTEGRPGSGRSGRPVRPDGVLLRGRRGRRVEDDGRRHVLGAGQRRLLQHRGGGRPGRERLGPERDLCRDGRVLHPRQCYPRRRRVQVHRRGQDVEARGAGGHAAHRAGPSPSHEPRPGVRRRSRARVRTQRGARGIQVEGRRRYVGEGAVQERQGRRNRPVAGRVEPAHHVRGRVGDAEGALQVHERRAGQRSLQVDGRGRHLDRHHLQPGTAGRRQGADRRRCLSRQAGAGLGDHRGREAGAVPVGRRRRDVGARQRRRQPATAAVVLRPRIHRPAGREHLLRAEPEHVESRRTGASPS